MFSALDWLVIAAYFVVLAGIGVYFSGRNRNVTDFMFGGGNMPWLAVGISLIATSISASTFLGNPAYTFANDMRLLMLGAGSIAAIFIIGAVFIPRYKNAGISSAYELLERRFSRPVRVMAAGLYSCHLMMRVGMLMYVPSLVIQKMTGLAPWACILIMAVGSIVYTYFGGIRAIAYTDVLQFSIFMGSGLMVVAYCAHAIGGFGETFRLASEAGKTRWFDATFDPGLATNIWSAGLVYIVFEVAIRGCDQQFVQRYLACKSAREANLSSVTSVLLGLCVSLLFYAVGATLYVYFKVKAVSPLPEGVDANSVFPYFIMNILPIGIKGLLGAAILGEAMSSLNSTYSALSNTTVVDFLRRGGGTGSHAEAAGKEVDGVGGLRTARLWVLIWGGLGTAMAFVCALGSKTILDKALFFTSLFTGPLLGLFLLAFFRPHLHPKAVLTAAILAMATLLPFLQIPILPEGLWKPLYSFAWPWNPLISVTATVIYAHVLGLFWRR